MTSMLASVRSFEEAQLALACGADILDLKEPARGALGAVSPELARTVVSWANRRVPISATVGDIYKDTGLVRQAVKAMVATGVDVVKVGLFDEAERPQVLRTLEPFARGAVKLVGVLFADRSPNLAIGDVAAAGFFGVMIDTSEKSSGSLRSHINGARLREFVMTARGMGLRSGLAGGLTLEDITPLLECGPDYLGFRGALCDNGQRQQTLNAERIGAVRACIPRSGTDAWNSAPRNRICRVG